MSTNSAASPTGETPRYGVLYVDDEEQALKYFKKAFGNAFPIFTANSVDAGIAVLETEHANIGVLVTDHRMPGKTGVEFLAQVKEKWPGIMRIMVTAYADRDSAITAVNSGSVFKYLTKPVDLPTMKQVLVEAMSSFTAGRSREEALSEKSGLLERMIVADRVRSLSTIATGISHHVRNSLTAMTCFFEEMSARHAQAGNGAPSDDEGYLKQLMVLADQERERLVRIVQDVEARGTQPIFRFEQNINLADLVAKWSVSAAGESPVQVDMKASVAVIRCDAAAMERSIRTLIAQARKHSPDAAAIRVSVEGPVSYWNGSAIRIRILGGAKPWNESDVNAFFTPFSLTMNNPGDVGLELLDAFQTVSGHEGDVVAHRAAPGGPGFEVLLPVDPGSVGRPKLVDGRLEMAGVR